MKKKYVNVKIPNFSINSTDIAILLYCFTKGYSMAELHRELNIAYKNLAVHIKKLQNYGFIIVKDRGVGKGKIISLNPKNEKQIMAFIWLFNPKNVDRKI